MIALRTTGRHVKRLDLHFYVAHPLREYCRGEQARKLLGIRRPPLPHKFVELIEENYGTFRFLKHAEHRIRLGLDSIHSIAEQK